MEAEIKDKLRATLRKLNAEEFKTFKHHLKDKNVISACDLSCDLNDVVDKIVEWYTIRDCVKETVEILEKMGLRQKALDLKNDFKHHNSFCQNDIYSNPRVNVSVDQTDRKPFLKRRMIEEDTHDNFYEDIRQYMSKCFTPFTPFTLYPEILAKHEEERITALRNAVRWDSGHMKMTPSTQISLISQKITDLEAELEAGTNQKEKRKTHLRLLQEELGIHHIIKLTFDRAADHIERLQTEEAIIEEFDRLRQFLQVQEEAWIARRTEEEEQKHRKIKEMMERMSSQISSLPATL